MWIRTGWWESLQNAMLRAVRWWGISVGRQAQTDKQTHGCFSREFGTRPRICFYIVSHYCADQCQGLLVLSFLPLSNPLTNFISSSEAANSIICLSVTYITTYRVLRNWGMDSLLWRQLSPTVFHVANQLDSFSFLVSQQDSLGGGAGVLVVDFGHTRNFLRQGASLPQNGMSTKNGGPLSCFCLFSSSQVLHHLCTVLT